MKKPILISLILFLVLSFYSFSQIPSSYIATWKGDVTAAYTLTHDDFGANNVNGIEDYADTMAFNRGIRISFGPVIGQCDENDWAVCRRLVSHGHRVMNHTWNHRCGNPNAEEWCTAFGVWDQPQYNTEIDEPTRIIEEKSGQYPYFFIFPFDQYTETAVNYLVDNKNYLGSRTGDYDTGPNPANMANPSRPAFWVTRPEYNIADVIQSIHTTVQQGAWGVREFHGVQDGSWGSVTETHYRMVLDLLRQYVKSGDMWSAPTAEVIAYLNQRKAYTPTISHNNTDNILNVTWANNNTQLNTTNLITPITLVVELNGIEGNWNVTQNAAVLSDVEQKDGKLLIEVYPHKGDVQIKDETTTVFANFSANKTTVFTGDQVVFTDFSSQGTTGHSWSFGNGANPPTAVGKGPHTVTYSSKGKKTVSLNVTNATQEVKVDYIEVVDPDPIVDFTVDKTSASVSEKITFSDASTGDISSYLWTFGDGANPTTATGKGPHVVTYETSGTKSVNLEVNGAASTFKENFITIVDANNFSALSCYRKFDFKNNETDYVDGMSLEEVYLHEELNSIWTIESEGHDEWDVSTYDFNDGANRARFDFTQTGYEPKVTIRAKASDEVLMRVDLVQNDLSQGPVTTDNVSFGKNRIELSPTWQTYTIDFTGEFANAFGCGGNGCGEVNESDVRGLMLFFNPGYNSSPISGFSSEFIGSVEIDYILVGDSLACMQRGVTPGFYVTKDDIKPTANTTFYSSSTGNISSYKWDFGEGANPATATGEGPHNVSYSTTGLKNITLTLNDSEELMKENMVNVSNLNSANDRIFADQLLKAYPNPFNDMITIDLDESVKLLKLYSLDGTLIISEKGENMITSAIPSGTYIIEVVTNSNIYTKRIVKN